MIFLHPVLFFAGLIRFYQLKNRWWRDSYNILLIAVKFLLLTYFTVIDANLSARVIVISSFMAFLYLRISLEPFFWPGVRKNTIQWLLLVVLLPFVITTLYRITLYLPVSEIRPFSFLQHGDTIFIPMIIYVNFMSLVMAYSCISLTSNRLEKSLLETQSALDKANAAKSTFLGMVSHEMRTPLATVSGVIEALSKHPKKPEREELLSILQQSSHVLERHISDLLDLTGIEAGNIRIETKTFNLTAMFDEISALFKPRIESKGLQYRSQYSVDLPERIVADRQRIFQIITNLFENAIKASNQGAIDLTASLHGKRIKISISDTGRGMNPEQLETIFEPFVTLSPEGGTGLGLAVSQRLAEAMGGTLTAESVLGKGSCFVLTVPYQTPTETTFAESQPQKPVQFEKSLNLLIVDDLPENLMLLSLLLSETPFQLTTAGNGADALRILESQPIDILLTDMRMPDMDGLSLVRTIRADERDTSRQPLPIIGMSANAYSEDITQALAAGCDAYLTRPFSTNQLLQDIAAVTSTITQLCKNESVEQPEIEQQLQLLREAAKARVASSASVITAALECGDTTSIREEGHRLKGLGMSLRMADIERIGGALELTGREGKTESVAELVRELLLHG